MERYRDKFATEEIENMGEEIVFQVLHSMMEDNKKEFCRCNICLQDIAAIVLNRLPPLYYCNFLERLDPGQGLQQKMQDLRRLAEIEIDKAIIIVSGNAHH